MMDYKKIVDALRNDDLICPECERQAECNGEPGCLIRHDAADAIEALTVENARLRAELDAFRKDAAYYLTTNEEKGVVYIPKFVVEKWRGAKGENDV
jgi:hypothetical protein